MRTLEVDKSNHLYCSTPPSAHGQCGLPKLDIPSDKRPTAPFVPIHPPHTHLQHAAQVCRRELELPLVLEGQHPLHRQRRVRVDHVELRGQQRDQGGE